MQSATSRYFEDRQLVRHANVWHLWALGVGAVISGHFSGWNFGFGTGGWGGMLVAGIIIAIMYVGLVFSIAEMSPALPHTGAAYSFARTAMGPWGGFITGLCENVEYVVTPAVIAFFIGSYMGGIWSVAFPDSSVWPPLWWIVTYVIFLALNVFGVALSFRVTLIVTLLSLAVLVIFWISAIPNMDFSRWALNIGAGPDGAAIELPEGNGSFFPFGFSGVLATLPFAVWLFLAIEQLPLAAEESVDPKRDMPRGIIAGMPTLMVSAFMIVLLNPSVIGVGSFKLGTSGEPLLDGFRAIYGDSGAVLLGLIALVGLIASFHTIVFAMGRQVYSLSRAGYFPAALSVTHQTYKTPHVAMFAGAIVGLGIMLIMWFALGGEAAGSLIGSVLLNMAVFGAMFSYILQAVSFILLRQEPAEYRAALSQPARNSGRGGDDRHRHRDAALSDPGCELHQGRDLGDRLVRRRDRLFRDVGRHKLILSPEEEFALEHQAKA